MIPARSTKAVWICSVNDVAILKLDNADVRRYGETRDPKHIGLDTKTGMVEKTGETATLFLVEPLKQNFANLSDKQLRTKQTDMVVFAAHVKGALHTPEPLTFDGDRASDAFLDSLPLGPIEEIATVIIEMSTAGGRGSSVPFSLPAGCWAERSNSTSLLARAAQDIATPTTGTNRATVETAPSE